MSQRHPADPNTLRKWVHAPYAVDAKLEYVGRSDASVALKVRTREANAWGVRLASDQPLVEGADVRLSLPAPRGGPLRVFGVILSVKQDPNGGWQAAISFDAEEPQLSTVQIDLARLAA